MNFSSSGSHYRGWSQARGKFFGLHYGLLISSTNCLCALGTPTPLFRDTCDVFNDLFIYYVKSFCIRFWGQVIWRFLAPTESEGAVDINVEMKGNDDNLLSRWNEIDVIVVSCKSFTYI